MILPLVATGLSVAEERNLGMASWHRTLPPSLRKQWLVKMTVVLGTGVLLGVILPCLLGVAGWAIGLFPNAQPAPDQPMQWPTFSELLATFFQLLPSCLAYLLVLMMGIFASSVSRTTFRAILLTLALLAGIAALIPLSAWAVSLDTNNLQRIEQHGAPQLLPTLMSLGAVSVGLAIGLAGLGLLAYANYRTAEPSPRRAWLHSGIILGVMAFFSTAFWFVMALYGHPG
jgi:uncharacterized BrkB/YihY/UPF0761 family membrane protein